MKIGDVAARLGISASTIRYYEQQGLIDHQQRISGRREFNEQAVFALEFVRLAQAAGFSIAEIKLLLESYARDPSAAGAWHEPASQKRQEIRKQLEALEQIDSILTELLSCQCTSLTQCVEAGLARGVGAQQRDE